MKTNIELLRSAFEIVEAQGRPLPAAEIKVAIAEIERLRAQNVGQDEGRDLAALDAEATPGEWVAHREGFITPKGDTRLGVAIADGIGDPKNWPANRAFIIALVTRYRARKRGMECGVPAVKPEIHSPAQ